MEQAQALESKNQRWQKHFSGLAPFLSFAFVVLPLGFIIQFTHQKLDIKLNAPNVDKVLLPNKEIAKMLSLGNESLLADWYWLGFVQYLGDSKARFSDHYAYCDKYLDLVTYLDPRFVEPYWFVAFSVGSDQKRPDLAAKLIDRGIQANQYNWTLPFIAGVNQYLFAHDERAAARYYRMASKFPQAPDWLRRQALVLESHIPALVKEMRTWAIIYSSDQSPLVRQEAKNKLVAIWSRIYGTAPTPQVKSAAKHALENLGVAVE
jgi:hypothetical protein